MNREVAILGVGMTPFRRLSGRTLAEMGWEAGQMALKDAPRPGADRSRRSGRYFI